MLFKLNAIYSNNNYFQLLLKIKALKKMSKIFKDANSMIKAYCFHFHKYLKTK